MQPLGSADLMAAYHERISGDHDYKITVEVLNMDEYVVGRAQLLDGQIDIIRDTQVRRTLRVTLLDPDHSLGLDSESVFAGSAAANRMLRVRHTVDVPGYGEVTCTPFVGPIIKPSRNGATLDVEAHEKTHLAITGAQPYTVHRGMNAMHAVRAIMSDRYGETRFRLPAGVRYRLRRHYSVSWPDETSGWARVQQICNAAGLRAYYTCDGYLAARAQSSWPVLEFGGDGVPITVAPAADPDFSQIVNYSRVEADKIVVVRKLEPTSTHPFSPGVLGRHGVPRHLPSLTEISGPGTAPQRPGTKHRKASKAESWKYHQELEKYDALTRSITSKAASIAQARLDEGLSQDVNLTLSTIPVFHLDYGDAIRVTTPDGSQVVRFTEGSIPLVSGDMSIGILRQVSRPGRIRV